jgi:Fe-S cluster assembly protein SufD
VQNEISFSSISYTDSSQDYNIINNILNVSKNAKFTHNVFSLGSGFKRQNITYNLEKNSITNINGLTFANSKSHHDIYSTINHLSTDSYCNQGVKAVATNASTSVFKGMVSVPETTSRITNHQLSNNILLCNDSKIVCQPCLQIDQNDIECSHGATIGALDEEALFFMTSRGIDSSLAKNMLINAF